MKGEDQIGQQDCNGAVFLEWLNDGSASWVYQEADTVSRLSVDIDL